MQMVMNSLWSSLIFKKKKHWGESETKMVINTSTTTTGVQVSEFTTNGWTFRLTKGAIMNSSDMERWRFSGKQLRGNSIPLRLKPFHVCIYSLAESIALHTLPEMIFGENKLVLTLHHHHSSPEKFEYSFDAKEALKRVDTKSTVFSKVSYAEHWKAKK